VRARAGFTSTKVGRDAASRSRALLGTSVGLLALALATGCSKTPAEPEPSAAASASETTVAPLAFEVPGVWTELPAPRGGGPKKAVYKVPKTGDDKEDAELDVVFFGTGAEGDETRRFGEMFGLFDGDLGKTAPRDRFETHGMPVETFDVVGTYKVPLAPPVGPKKIAPVQMVKDKWRMLGAVVKTKDRGNWFFKLVGPDDTVQAARESFRRVLESAH
jgi:hypothetical protein